MPYIHHSSDELRVSIAFTNHLVLSLTMGVLLSYSNFVAFLTLLFTNTMQRCTQLKHKIQTCKISSCLVQMAVAPVSSRGKQSAVMVTCVCCCHARNKPYTQSPLSSSTHRGLFWELVNNFLQNELQTIQTVSVITKTKKT